MVFYYSATGNCRWIAKKIAAALNDKAVDIVGEDPKPYCDSHSEIAPVRGPPLQGPR